MILALTALLLQARLCTLTVKGLDPFGQLVAVSVLELTAEDGQILKVRESPVSLACGLYRYEGKVGSVENRGVVLLREKKRLLVLGGTASASEIHVHKGPPPSATGTVDGTLLDRGAGWLRVQSIHDPSFYRDIEIEDGKFQAVVVPAGNCSLLLFRGGKPVAATFATIPDVMSIRIELTGDLDSPRVQIAVVK